MFKFNPDSSDGNPFLRHSQKKEPVEFIGSIDINPKKRELLINGFIREWNKKQKEDNKQIPNELLIVIVSFYPYHEIVFAESGNKIYKKTEPSFVPTTGVLNTIFNDKMCDKFTIKFLIKECHPPSQIIFGYLHKWNYPPNTNERGLGWGKQNTSVGVEIRGFADRGPKVKINETNQSHSSSIPVVKGSIIEMVFDFKNNLLWILHKEDCLCTSGLCGRKRVIVGVAVHFHVDIEFLECNFD